MTSFFDRQFNCLSAPEKELTWAFLLIALDPLSPGMPKPAYDAAWIGLGGEDGDRERAYRAAFRLINVRIEPFDFVVSLEGAWFAAYLASIASGDSNPIGPCPCDSF
jgi:hypothetical protein